MKKKNETGLNKILSANGNLRNKMLEGEINGKYIEIHENRQISLSYLQPHDYINDPCTKYYENVKIKEMGSTNTA